MDTDQSDRKTGKIMENSMALNLLTLLVLMVIALALRPVYNWYCRQDELIKTNEKILEELRLIRISIEMKDKNKKEEINFTAER